MNREHTMPGKHVAILGTLAVLILLSSTVARSQESAKHPGAEKAMAKIVLKRDFGALKFRSRQVVTIAQNDKVPGLNGLMFMKWKGGPGTEVMASVQWFAKKDDLLTFYAKSKKRADYKLGKFEKTTLWKIGEAGYLWTDGEHFLVSLGGSPAPPPEMVKAWLGMIPSKVAEVEKEAKKKEAKKEAERKRVPK